MICNDSQSVNFQSQGCATLRSRPPKFVLEDEGSPQGPHPWMKCIRCL